MYYEKVPGYNKLGIRYVVYVFLLLITLVAVLAWSVVAYHWKFEHTYMLPAGSPQGLTTERRGPVYWVLLPVTVTRILLIVTATARSANPRDRLMSYALNLVAVVAAFSEIAGLVIFINERRGCNNPPDGDPSGRFNMCNDYRWPCVYGTTNLTIYEPSCEPNATMIEPSAPLALSACVPTVYAGDLTSNWVFDASLGGTVIFLALSILHVLIGSWMGNGTEAQDYADASDYPLDSFVGQKADGGLVLDSSTMEGDLGSERYRSGRPKAR